MFCYKYMIKRENYLIVADVADAKTQDKIPHTSDGRVDINVYTIFSPKSKSM